MSSDDKNSSVNEISLEGFSDDELTTMAKHGDFGIMISPIKNAPRHYSRFVGLLGRMDKKSELVKINLPRIAVKLYKSYDQNYIKIMNVTARDLKENFLGLVNLTLGREVTVEELGSLSNEETAEMFADFDRSAQGNGRIDLELAWVQYKLCGIPVSEEDKQDITRLFYEKTGKGRPEMEAPHEDVTTEPTPAGAALPEPQAAEPEKAEAAPSEAKQQEKKKGGKTPKEKAEQTKAARKRAEEEKQQKEDSAASVTDIQVDTPAPAGSGSDPQTEPEAGQEPKAEEQPAARDQGEKKLRTYLGYINVIKSFYNFNPIAEYNGKSFYYFKESELDNLLPASQYRNINLAYAPWIASQDEFMQAHFYADQLVFMDFEVDKLERNEDSDGTLRTTGYKVTAQDVVKNHVLRFLHEENFYEIKTKDVLTDDDELENHNKLAGISYNDIRDGQQILIRMDGMCAGPYEVKYRPTSDDYYIRTDIQENKYLIKGYAEKDCERVIIDPMVDVRPDGKQWSVYRIRDGAQIVYKDVVTDEMLLEAFKNGISRNGTADVSLDNVQEVISNFNDSILTGEQLTQEIRDARRARLANLLSSEADLTRTYQNISDILIELILKNKDDARTEALLASIIEKRPEILESMQNVSIVRGRVDNLKEELEQLQMRKAKALDDLNDIAKSAQQQMHEEIDEKQRAASENLEKLEERLGLATDVDSLRNEVKRLNDDVRYYESHKEHLVNDTKNLESQFVELINRNSDRMVDITFDGFMSNKMLQAAARWEKQEDSRQYSDIVSRVNALEPSALRGKELADYIVGTIQKVRPLYDRNTILNLVICASQGFLTVLSGTPGCGKTSICNILAKTLGLNEIDRMAGGGADGSLNRYIPVSVERGWTSKRDFIGYYNPLTKAFEESNRDVFDGLRMLDAESSEGRNKFPYLILLDEANLSPVEYYWADFMNVCDDLQDNHTVNLGNNSLFRIPETLHFLATINNDHTTETLSPRLIDRAWIITLPKVTKISYGNSLQADAVELIGWEALKETFVAPAGEDIAFDNEIQKIYDQIRKLLNSQDMTISPRADIAMHRYCYVASRLMEDDEFDNSSSVVALDYAVAQKILPKIMGSGDEYLGWLNSLMECCEKNNLNMSKSLLSNIIERGNKQMKYFQFFN